MQVNSSKDCGFTTRPHFRALDLMSVHLSIGLLPSNKYHLAAGRNEDKKGIKGRNNGGFYWLCCSP